MPDMTDRKRQMHLGVFVLGTGNHSAGWRYEGATGAAAAFRSCRSSRRSPSAGSSTCSSSPTGLAMDPGDHPSFVNRFEPTHAALGVEHGDAPHRPRRHRIDELRRAVPCRARLRLARPSQRRPRRLERRDQHPRQGGAELQQDQLAEHDLRYEIATEFVDVVRGLWDSLGRRRRSSPTRRPASTSTSSKVRPLDHKGRFYSVKGPLNIERPPQGHPVIIQAGGSPPGQELSARSADLVFSVVNGDKASAKAAYDSLKQRVVKHGRAPHEVPILPGVMPIIGETDAAGEGATRPPAKLADADQRARAGVAAHRARHLRLPAGRSGS